MAVEMRITLRLPLPVHAALLREAKAASISLNQLIVERLNASAGSPYRGGTGASVADRVDILEDEVAAIKAKLGM
ncbi:toxin-antitoxin system HicB family antitoxin [Aurantimonas sp. C2-6-R+9]|uniref:toxin-antitoxin system HicB family antitoxin n=1 Tax=unclassified Aurantimonas TaxID=2638230 RepID=UPI002E18563E|nr:MULTISPECIES: toxin-antitoxin system HicB family antitoxin [unclassified Aurantimonas]MEC5293815.1 toxin-antitoxin system HicB family antitoxin [Aurantimonas sp. C2-3-R2]MEC5383185.1 toxin-antitoxin system HicB family antitoxin [Aurantimonas sp. C2-6-R+9]MEC5414198.1 toxin-antitoxin system HicB family antitoxin [Aurantimonas sp. C2-4-R8]